MKAGQGHIATAIPCGGRHLHLPAGWSFYEVPAVARSNKQHTSVVGSLAGPRNSAAIAYRADRSRRCSICQIRIELLEIFRRLQRKNIDLQ